MTPWYSFFIYIITFPWDALTWPMIVLIRLFWGENLCWESESTQGTHCLTCDLKVNSWPARTWYAQKFKDKDGKKVKRENHPSRQEARGKWVTWAGTTLGPHAIFYGPGIRVPGVWGTTQEHEHRHSEQGEAAMLTAFMYAIPVFIYSMVQGGLLWVMSLVMWTLGYVSMVANFLIALLRGESAYRGSVHEEGAYDRGKVFSRR